MHTKYGHFIPYKGQGKRLCGNKTVKALTSMHYNLVDCKKCLKIFDDAQEEAIMEAEGLAS